MKNMKILRPAINLAICVVAILICLATALKFEGAQASTNYTSRETLTIGDYAYSVTDYSYYGGDAYTGMQQASADASNNVIVLGINVTDAANMLHDAQRNTANNVAALAAPLNAAAGNLAAIGSMLSIAMALAFALPGVKNLFELLQALQEEKEKSAAAVPQPEVPAEEAPADEEPQPETPAEEASSAEEPQPEAPAEIPAEEPVNP